MRRAGSNYEQVEARKRDELIRFNLVLGLDELAVTRLRMTQSLRREPQLEDLLSPGIVEIDRVTTWLREVMRSEKEG